LDLPESFTKDLSGDKEELVICWKSSVSGYGYRNF